MTSTATNTAAVKPTRPATAAAKSTATPAVAASSKSNGASSAAAAPRVSAFTRDGEKAHGRAFSANESKQYELVHDFKPDWNGTKVLEFCKKHGFDEKIIQNELTKEFECQ